MDDKTHCNPGLPQTLSIWTLRMWDWLNNVV